MARNYTQQLETSRTTTTSATYQNKIDMFVSSFSNTVVFMTCLLDGSATNSDARVRLRNTSAGTDQLLFNIEAQDTTDVVAITGFTLIDGTGLFGLDDTYAIEYSSESGGTTGISDAYLVRLEMDAADKANQNLVARSTTSSAYWNLCAVSCTAGDWLLLASGEINTTDTTPATTLNFQLHDGTNELALTGPPYVQDTTNYTPLWLAAYVNPTQTTNYTLRWKSDGTATLQSENVRLLALDLSKFKRWKIINDPSSVTVNGTTPTTVEELEVNYTGDDNYLIIFACSNSGTATTSSQLLDFTLDNGNGSGDTALNTRTIIREMNDVNEFYDTGGVVVANLKNKRNVFKQKASAEVSGQSTTSKNNVIAMLQLGDTRLNRRTITVR